MNHKWVVLKHSGLWCVFDHNLHPHGQYESWDLAFYYAKLGHWTVWGKY